MLLGNIALLLNSPSKFFGGTSLSCERANFNNPGDERNIFIGQGGIDKTGGQPNGVRHPYTWTMPKGDGGLASFLNSRGSGDFSLANLAGGKNATATIAGLGEFTNVVLFLISSAAANISNVGQITNANLAASLFATASLEGTSDASASIEALANLAAGLTGTTSSDILLTALGTLESDITPFTELSPENLAQAVWNALLQDNADPGTFGERIQKLLTTGKFLGLK